MALPSAQTTQSYWLKDAPFQSEPTTPLPTKADIVIIGGGLTGLSTAYHLRTLNQKATIILVDARGIASGATGRNGGLLWPGLDGPYHNMKPLGHDNLMKLLEFDSKNTEDVRNFIEREGDHDGGWFDPQLTFLDDGGVMLFKEEEHWKKYVDGIKEMENDGLNNFMVPIRGEELKKIVKSDQFYGGVKCSKVAILWAAKLVFTIARAATRSTVDGIPVNIFPHTPVTSTTKLPSGLYSVSTPRGIITTPTLIHCTNAWTASILPTIKITPVRNQLISLRPRNPSWASPQGPSSHERLWNCAISANDGYEYLSQRASGEIVLGGLRNRTKNFEIGDPDDGRLDPTISKHLRAYMDENFPGLLKEEEQWEVTNEWIGVMGFTPAGSQLPLIGPLESTGSFIAAGFSGHGMPRCFLAGKAVAEMVVTGGEELTGGWFPKVFLPSQRGANITNT